MSEYGCNDLVPHSNMVFINGGLTTNALNYEIDGIKPEYTLTFRIIVRSIKSGWSAIIRKGTDQERHRGPCIWLTPGGTKLYPRISTINNWDDGIAQSKKSLILNHEHHVGLVLTNNGEDQRLLLYIDGECDSIYVVNSQLLYRKDMPFTLGGNAEFPSFNGVLDRPRFYNYAITDEFIIREDMLSKTPLVRCYHSS